MPWGHSVPVQAETVPILELDARSLCQHAVSKPQVVQLAGVQHRAVSAFGWELQSGMVQPHFAQKGQPRYFCFGFCCAVQA